MGNHKNFRFMEDNKMDFIKNLLESIYDMVLSILKAAGVNVDAFAPDLFPAE